MKYRGNVQGTKGTHGEMMEGMERKDLGKSR